MGHCLLEVPCAQDSQCTRDVVRHSRISVGIKHPRILLISKNSLGNMRKEKSEAHKFQKH